MFILGEGININDANQPSPPLLHHNSAGGTGRKDAESIYALRSLPLRISLSKASCSELGSGRAGFASLRGDETNAYGAHYTDSISRRWLFVVGPFLGLRLHRVGAEHRPRDPPPTHGPTTLCVSVCNGKAHNPHLRGLQPRCRRGEGNGELLRFPVCFWFRRRCCCPIALPHCTWCGCSPVLGPAVPSRVRTREALLSAPPPVGNAKPSSLWGALAGGPGPIPASFPVPTQFLPQSPSLSALRARLHPAPPHSNPPPSPSLPSFHPFSVSIPSPSSLPFPRRPLRSHPVADGGTVRPHRAAPLLGGGRDPPQLPGGPPPARLPPSPLRSGRISDPTEQHRERCECRRGVLTSVMGQGWSREMGGGGTRE